MAVPCTSCGEPVSDTDVRCPACDALAPLDTSGSPPWSIPLRGPSVPDPDPDPEPAADVVDPRRVVTVGVVVIAVVAALVVVAGQLVAGGGGSDDVAGGTGPGASSPDEPTEVASRDEDAGTSTSTSSSTSSSTTTSTTTTTAPSTTTSSTTTVPAPSAGSVPVLSSSFRGWVAQLTSVPTSAGADSLESAWSQARTHAGDAVATRSDQWSSMNPGYWVIVAPGPFGSEDAVRNFCAAVGRGSDGCLPRMLSDRR